MKEGTRFGRLVAVREVERSPSDKPRWLWQCDCGAQKVILVPSVLAGLTTSCGCRHREVTIARSTKHGQRWTREYRIWSNMKTRCLNPQPKDIPVYRGVKICERWKKSFAAFLEDMGPAPSPKHSIDRRNGKLGYTPSNCRWATSLEQGANTRKNHVLTFRGQTLHVAEWARRIGISHSLLLARVGRLGWSIEKALSTPSRPRRRSRMLDDPNSASRS